MENRPTLGERLLAKSKKKKGCLIWTGMVQTRGNPYGMIREGGENGGRLVPVHRAAWFVRFGAWPDHKLYNQCGNTLCINTDHWVQHEPIRLPINPEGNRRRWLRSRYGITLEEYEAMLKAQKGRCAICKTKPDGNLSVDHCHKTKKIRGLLCRDCNTALGLVKDSPKILQKMVKYLVA